MSCDFTVPYPSNKLVMLLTRIGDDIENLYVKERNGLVNEAKTKTQNNVFSRMWHGDGWEKVVYIDRAYFYKKERIAELLLAASIGDTVQVSADVFKWLNHHDNEDWCW